MREQMTFYRSYWEAVKRLRKSADRLSALEAILAYALDGEELDRTDAADAIFVLVKPFLDVAARKSKGGKIASRVEEESDKTTGRVEEESDNNIKNKKKNKLKVKNNMLENSAHTRFTSPTLDEVAAYCSERGNGVDPQQFIDFYTSKGWKVGDQPMKDWKAAVRTWERRDGRQAGQEKVKSFADIWREMPDE
ncbi:MAG: hypothetical protein IIZ83_08815 [Oscillospiraceae bacterium]|nr:hypothetical protein [Oscillospiraceae bacterium]